jgi:regulator of cell morphogenesis and NO signaling
VPEQLTLGDAHRQRRAVDMNQRLLGPRRGGVNLACDEFFSRARLARDQNGKVRFRDEARRLRESLPELIRMAEKVETRHGEKASCPKGLAAHLISMHEFVLEHLSKEEQVLFPLIANGQGRIAVGPVHVMEMEHEEHARALAILRRLTNNFDPPAEACITWRALYLGLRQLEEELMVHIHLENNVLFRRALIE